MSGALPLGYSEIERRFFDAARGAGREGAVSVHEYSRAGWTFHAKGLWCTGHSAADPAAFLNVVGSSNFGVRSVTRDVELQFVVEGVDASLAASLSHERDALFKWSTPVSDSTWGRADRAIGGLRWADGTWLHLGWRMFKPFM